MYVANARRLRNIVLIAVIAAAVGGFALYELVTVVNKGAEGIIKKDATQLVLALVKHDAALAPDGGADWVPGVWTVFRRVDSASVVKVWKRPQNGRNFGSSGSEWVADILFHTGRGLVLLELAFRSPGVSDLSQKVDLLYELRPQRIPEGLFDGAMLARLASAQRERGPKIADDLVITIAGRTGEDPAKPKAAVPTATRSPRAPKIVVPRPKLPPVIRCIRRVRPDVQKIQECVRLYGP
jgi:hypothetical protein